MKVGFFWGPIEPTHHLFGILLRPSPPTAATIDENFRVHLVKRFAAKELPPRRIEFH